MARLTKKMEKDFTVVHNEFIRDKSLGLTASAESTAREKLNRNLHRLRKLAYKNLSFLENEYLDN